MFRRKTIRNFVTNKLKRKNDDTIGTSMFFNYQRKKVKLMRKIKHQSFKTSSVPE